MHSNYSSDGKQSLKEILERTKALGFDIISITDHDDVRVYNELFELSTQEDLNNFPIVITGIEYTTSYPLYGEMCHILKHFIDPTNKNILNDIKIVENSYFNRAKIQLNRVFESGVLRNIIEENNIEISYNDFLEYLKNKGIIIPDYAPLIDYLADKFKEKDISTLSIFEKLIEENNSDPCKERKNEKTKRFEKLKEKYKDIDIQDNRRFLLSILAVRGVDDDKYKGYPSSGSLSVNEYGQVDIFKLNSNGITTFAHPTERVIETLYNCKNIGGELVGIENNSKNNYLDFKKFENVRDTMKLIELKGSDCHSTKENIYDDMEKYKLSLLELEKYLHKVKRILLWEKQQIPLKIKIQQ